MYTVTGLLHEVSSTIKNQKFSSISITGEVSNLSISRNHIFFSLRDDYSLLNCIGNKDLLIEQGDSVEITGTINIYAPKGSLQLKAKTVSLKGEGSYKKTYRRSKKQLYKQKILPKQDKKIPSWPQNIAVITSKNGAVLQDILDIFKQSVSPPQTTVYNTSVQGKDSPTQIRHVLQKIDTLHECIIIARGGGSTTDLEGYNDFLLAKAIAKTQTPIVTSIGHKKDTAIADLVSDKSVSTPTKAATIITKQKKYITQRTEQIIDTAHITIKNKLREKDPAYIHQKAQNTIKNKLNKLKKELNNIKETARQHPFSTLMTPNACLLYKDDKPICLKDVEGTVKAISHHSEKHITL